MVTSLTTCVLTDITQYKVSPTATSPLYLPHTPPVSPLCLLYISQAKYARSQLREAFDLPPKQIQFDGDDGDDDDDDGTGDESDSSRSKSRSSSTKGKRSSSTSSRRSGR